MRNPPNQQDFSLFHTSFLFCPITPQNHEYHNDTSIVVFMTMQRY